MVDIKLKFPATSRLVILKVTLDSEHRTIPDDEEVRYVFDMDVEFLQFYLDESYFKHGNKEGADNLMLLVDALKEGYTMDQLVIVVKEV